MTFLMPEDGAIVHPGEKLHVEVSVPSGMAIEELGLLGTLGFAQEIREAPPYSFTMIVPDQEMGWSNNLIGVQEISAWGLARGKNDDLGLIHVDVEMPDMPSKLEGADGSMDQYNKEMWFNDVGTDTRLSIYGTFPDGKDLDVTNSTHLKLLSGNTAVIRVSPDGTVMSAGPGRTSVIATYSLGEQNIRLMVPVKVELPSRAVVPAPWTVDFGDVSVGGTSGPQTVTLTNQTDAPMGISKFEIAGIFKESDNCTGIQLPARGGTCSLTVTFAPDRAGPQYLRVALSDSPYFGTSILLLGNGV